MRTIRQTTIALLGLLLQAATVMGADDGFAPTEAHAAGTWKNWLAMALFFAAVGIVAFKNARRTHLD